MPCLAFEKMLNGTPCYVVVRVGTKKLQDHTRSATAAILVCNAPGSVLTAACAALAARMPARCRYPRLSSTARKS
jgi:hypothetical protein